MTTSVAMCTYNGARYIEEQLRSIINQTVPVGEIVVCDDGSKDETVDIIKNIALTTSIPIRIYINDVNLGCTKNFYKAMSLCEGDIIFLSDQDDVWLSHKVETILNWFKVNNDKKVLFSDAELINSEGELIIDSTYFSLNFDEKSQQFFNNGFAVELFAHRNRACGATMALRKGVLSFLLPLFENKEYKCVLDKCIGYEIMHDYLIALVAVCQGELGYLSDVLTKYRQHSNQVYGMGEFYKYNDAPYFIDYCKGDRLIHIPYVGNNESVQFLEYRRQSRRNVLTFLIIWFDFIKYKKIYCDKCFLFIKYDIIENIKYTIYKIKFKLKQKKA